MTTDPFRIRVLTGDELRAMTDAEFDAWMSEDDDALSEDGPEAIQ